MNERIKELFTEAGLHTLAGYAPGHEWKMEKFAELIVKECAEVAHCNFHVSGIPLGVILKEHFGV